MYLPFNIFPQGRHISESMGFVFFPGVLFPSPDRSLPRPAARRHVDTSLVVVYVGPSSLLPATFSSLLPATFSLEQDNPPGVDVIEN